MNALLICPADRPAVACLAENTPLATTPLLGRTLVEYWVESLASRGVKRILVLASDRPHHVRAVVNDGTRWGVQVEVLPQSRELTIGEARQKYASSPEFAEEHILLLDCLPGLPDHPLFESYAGWFKALQSYFPLAITPSRLGMREVHPGVWIGLHAQIAPTAQLQAPCWIGEAALISENAVIGPGAVVENCAIIESGARVTESIIGPETFVGQMISVNQSIAHGSTLVNWKNDSCLRVPDAFFLCSLSERRFAAESASPLGRLIALLAMILTSPIALVAMLISLLRGENTVQLRLGVRPQRNVRSAALQTFAYYELASGSNWLKRWPQFWSVVRGDLAWVGNRPLRPTQALELTNDFERLWLAAPVGLISLADAHGCTEGMNDEICAHASYYAVNASRRLDWFVLTRGFFRAAFAIPIRRRSRRAGAAVALTQLVPEQES
ncbi:MAG: sugar transferase [Verrucomicrobiota bacterium]